MWTVDVKLATELGSQLITALRRETMNHQASYPRLSDIKSFDMPAGFEYVGMGDDRIVWRYDDTVFKVEWSSLFDDVMSYMPNSTEFYQASNWRNALDAWPQFSIPSMELIYVDGCEILVMPYVEGDTLEAMINNAGGYGRMDEGVLSVWNDFTDTVPIMDLHTNNVIFNNGVYYLIDLGSDL